LKNINIFKARYLITSDVVLVNRVLESNDIMEEKGIGDSNKCEHWNEQNSLIHRLTSCNNAWVIS